MKTPVELDVPLQHSGLSHCHSFYSTRATHPVSWQIVLNVSISPTFTYRQHTHTQFGMWQDKTVSHSCYKASTRYHWPASHQHTHTQTQTHTHTDTHTQSQTHR